MHQDFIEPAPPNVFTQFLRGAKFFWAGWQMLFWQRQLLWLSLVPLALTIVMLAGLAWLFSWLVSQALLTVFAFLFGTPGEVAPPLAWSLQAVAFLLGLYLATTIYLPLARVLLAPFSEALSRKTHELMHAGLRYQSALGWARAMWEGLKLVALQILILGAGFLVSFPLPVIGHFFLLALTIIVCGLDYLDVPLSARGLPLRRKLALLWRHKALVAGFAGAAYLLLLIPFVNILSLPVGVIGATLMTDQLPDETI